MTEQEIADALKNRKPNSFYSITTDRPGKTLKKCGDMDIRKVSKFQGMLTDYARRGPVREGIESGERDAPELPKHIAESFEVEGVRFWRGHNGEVYFPIVLGGNHTVSEWLLDGEACKEEDIREFLQASETYTRPDKEELAEKHQVPFVAVKLGNVVSIR